MKIIASYILHYGVEWLYWSMRSVVPFVDEIHLFYTPWPSHGHTTNLKCPESREMLKTSYLPLMMKDIEIIWHDCPVRFAHEGEHRTFAIETCKQVGADIVVISDADELWPPLVLQEALEYVVSNEYRSYRIGMRHFWKSLNWVCDDAAMPTRFVRPNIAGNSEQYLSGKVFHMGYAQTPKTIEYKMSIHGHKNEWRAGWFENIFLPWQPYYLLSNRGDVHPTSVDYWNPMPYVEDGQDTLAYLCDDHPYYSLDIIR